MEGERKKRKLQVEEEEDEEEKIEKFFALIKSTRKVCEMLKGSSNWPLKKKDQSKQEEDHPVKTSTWNPAFQPEDFLDQDDKDTSAVHIAGTSKIPEEEEKEEDEGGNGLDLKLSL